MTRVLTYNILLGGTRRVEQLTQMITSSAADVVALVEATDAQVVIELARRLDMHYYITGHGTHPRDWQMAVLSRLPIISTQVYHRPDIFARKNLLEVCVQESSGTQISIFVIHQPAGLRRNPGGRKQRRREIHEIITIMSQKANTPHVLLGDFNSIAPGDRLKGSRVILYQMQEFERDMQQHPARFARMSEDKQLKWRRRRERIRTVLSYRLGRLFLDLASRFYGQGGIDLLLRAGYQDSFRYLYPKGDGFTFPAAAPACRIDYIFASPELAQRLIACSVLPGAPDLAGKDASDHFPVYVDFL